MQACSAYPTVSLSIRYLSPHDPLSSPFSDVSFAEVWRRLMSLVAAITLVARQGLHHTALPHPAFNSLTSDPGQRALDLKLSGFQPVKRLAIFLDDLKVEQAG